MKNSIPNGDSMSASSVASSLPVFILESLQTGKVTDKVLAKANLPAENVCEILRDSLDDIYSGPQTLKTLETLRSRAFLCLNNLISALSIEDMGGVATLFTTWTGLGQLCFGEDNAKSDVTLLESATSALRALTEKLVTEGGEESHAHFGTLSADDLKRMLTFGASVGEAKIRMNLVHIAGSIGALCASKAPDSPSSEFIASFLVEAATKDVDLRVVAEALDKLFDLFAEDNTDNLAVKVELVPKLTRVKTSLAVKMKQVRLSKEDSGVVSLVKMNLNRFIKYKSKRPIVAASLK